MSTLIISERGKTAKYTIDMAAAATAQLETLSESRTNSEIAKIAELAKNAVSPSLKAHLNRAAAKAASKDGVDAALLAAAIVAWV